MEQLEITLKVARPKALATMIRLTRDFDLAEEAVQESLVRALPHWRQHGIPDNAVAWLVQTARHYVHDRQRHQRMVERHHHALQQTQLGADATTNPEQHDHAHLSDDMLRLIFTCCHPALAPEAQIALTLKTIAGLDSIAIARAFLLTPKTLDQRVTRAKRRIRDCGIAYQVPDTRELPERLDAVLRVIYLIYNQSYTVASGPDLLDVPLGETAIALTRLLCRLLPGHTEPLALLALLLMQHARADARTDADGLPIPLEQQDRRLWQRALINEGKVLIEKCFRQQPQAGPYLLQAAIAAIHNRAATPEDTDWPQIVQLYTLLEQRTDNPVITLNRAIALARADGPNAGLALLNTLADHPAMQRFQYFHTSKAALLEENGNPAEALQTWEYALTLCQNQAEQRYICKRIDLLQARTSQ